MFSSPFLASFCNFIRLIIPSSLRKRLNLRRSSKILVSISKPQKIEKFKIKDFGQMKKILEKIDSADEVFFDGEFLFITNGCSSVKVSAEVCGASGPGSSPGYGPISKKEVM